MEFIEIGEYKIATDRKYMATHEWVKEVEDGHFLMGISDYAQKMLREITYVQFEEEGEEFDQKEVIAVVEALKASGDIYAPFSCTLVANHEELEDEPEKVMESPYEDGWLVKIKPNDDNRELLITPQEYAEVVKKELEEL